MKRLILAVLLAAQTLPAFADPPIFVPNTGGGYYPVGGSIPVAGRPVPPPKPVRPGGPVALYPVGWCPIEGVVNPAGYIPSNQFNPPVTNLQTVVAPQTLLPIVMPTLPQLITFQSTIIVPAVPVSLPVSDGVQHHYDDPTKDEYVADTEEDDYDE